MILPDKYEDLNKSIIVVGYRIIQLLREKELHILTLHRKLCKRTSVDLLYYFDVLTFLWLIDALEINNNKVSLKNDSKKNLH
ncbi:MAG: hypothetical protein M5T52_24225 [Ignavibacteriaceae bacterium]|nr:hypothetical protein [Ignavibacteriaceae bacterium]